MRGTTASIFAETEHAQALGKLKEVEPAFDAEAFLNDMTEFVIPEVIEAFWKNDVPTLRQWCTEAVRVPPHPFSVRRPARAPAHLTPRPRRGGSWSVPGLEHAASAARADDARRHPQERRQDL